MQTTRFFSLSADEVTLVVCQTSVYGYLCVGWKWTPTLFTLEHVMEGGIFNNLTNHANMKVYLPMPFASTSSHWGQMESLHSKYQNKGMYAIDKLACPIAVHCMADCANLEVQIFSYFPIAKHIEELFASLCTYINSSLNQTLSFKSL